MLVQDPITESSEELPEAFRDQYQRHREYKRQGRSSGSGSRITPEDREEVRSSLATRFHAAAPPTEPAAAPPSPTQTASANNPLVVEAAVHQPHEQPLQSQSLQQALQLEQAEGPSEEEANFTAPESRSSGGRRTRPAVSVGTVRRSSRILGKLYAGKTRSASRAIQIAAEERETRRRPIKRRTAIKAVGRVERKPSVVTARQKKGSS